MDEMNVVSKFTRNVISKIVKKTISKKFGYNIDVKLNELNVRIDNGRPHIHISIDTELNKEDFIKMIKDYI